MRFLLSFLLFLLCIAPASAQQITVPLTEDAWDLSQSNASFLTHLGQPALSLAGSGTDGTGANIALVRDLEFQDGTIEYDVAFRDDTRFTTVYFRRQDNDNTEHVYLRANAVSQPRVHTAVQYAAVVDGVNYWDLSHAYQSNADLRATAYNHVKIVVRDGRLLAYVNDMERPALYIPELDGRFGGGGIAFDGNVYISNVTVDPDGTGELPRGTGFDLTRNDSRYLRDWQVTAPTDLPGGREAGMDDLPGPDADWSPVSAERLGLINLSRRYGATPRGERRLAWLRTTITSERDQLRELDLGFSDEVYIFLNGQPLYVDKNLFATPGMKLPRGRLSLENTRLQLPLREGENELTIGLTNFFYGWGIVARLDDAGGLDY